VAEENGINDKFYGKENDIKKGVVTEPTKGIANGIANPF
jgi:hypothetical protein